MPSNDSQDQTYRYFVSYAHTRGFGSGEITRDHPITDWKALNAIKNAIEQDSPIGEVVILHFALLSGPVDANRPTSAMAGIS